MDSRLFKVPPPLVQWHIINYSFYASYSLYPVYLSPHAAVFEGGSVFPPSILDVKEEDLIQQFLVVC